MHSNLSVVQGIIEKYKANADLNDVKAKANADRIEAKAKANADRIEAKAKADLELTKKDMEVSIAKTEEKRAKDAANTAKQFLMYGYGEEYDRYQKKAGISKDVVGMDEPSQQN